MPLSKQQLRVDQAGRENVLQPRLRAAAFDLSERVTQRAAALEALFRADWERAARRSRGDLALTAESYLRARIVSSASCCPSWRLRSRSWLRATPKGVPAVRRSTERAPATAAAAGRYADRGVACPCLLLWQTSTFFVKERAR
jgi:hypothetical protein